MIDAGAHLGLVIRIARQIYPMNGVEADDVIGAGTVGLVQAAARYDEGAGVTFPTFAAPRIRGAMRDYLRLRWGRKGRKRREEVSLADKRVRAHLYQESGEEGALARVDAARMLARLEGRERAVVEGYFVRDRPLGDVARDIGVTISRASQIKRAALDGLRWRAS